MPADDLDASELERLEYVDQLGVLVEPEPHGAVSVVGDDEVGVCRPALLRGRRLG